MVPQAYHKMYIMYTNVLQLAMSKVARIYELHIILRNFLLQN